MPPHILVPASHKAALRLYDLTRDPEIATDVLGRLLSDSIEALDKRTLEQLVESAIQARHGVNHTNPQLDLFAPYRPANIEPLITKKTRALLDMSVPLFFKEQPSLRRTSQLMFRNGLYQVGQLVSLHEGEVTRYVPAASRAIPAMRDALVVRGLRFYGQPVPGWKPDKWANLLAARCGGKHSPPNGA